MKRIAAVLALAAALLGSTLAGTALGQVSNPEQDFDSPRVYGAPQGQDAYRGDGSWNDRDRNSNGWGRGRFNHANLEGRWVADNRSANYRSDRRDFRGNGARGILLPEVIRIDQRPTMVRIADSRHRPLQRIMIGGKFDSRYGDQSGIRPDYLLGHWRGRTLVVEHNTGPRGAAVTQTFTLENRGRSLVVRTRREGWGRTGTIEFTTVYHRA